jgi:hypothetical protein
MAFRRTKSDWPTASDEEIEVCLSVLSDEESCHVRNEKEEEEEEEEEEEDDAPITNH